MDSYKTYDIKALTVEERQSKGIYYTDRRLSDFHVASISSYFDISQPKCLEPSAGKGSYVRALKKHYKDYSKLVCVEPVIQNANYLKKNFENIEVINCCLEYTVLDLNYDLIVGNPPFYLFESHVEMCYKLLKYDGVLSFLLRINSLGSVKRKPFWRIYKPKFIISLSTRPSFYKSSKSSTDMTEYGLFMWQKGWAGRTELIISDWME